MRHLEARVSSAQICRRVGPASKQGRSGMSATNSGAVDPPRDRVGDAAWAREASAPRSAVATKVANLRSAETDRGVGLVAPTVEDEGNRSSDPATIYTADKRVLSFHH